MGLDPRHRSQESRTDRAARRSGLRGHADELVVRTRLGGVLHRRLLGPAGGWKDLPAQRSRDGSADPDAGADGRRCRAADRLVRKDLGKKKVFVLGHSWGSYLGVEIAQRHPEWLHAYIGVGKLADGPEGERRGWRFALGAARRAGNAEAVRELEALAPYAAPGKRLSIDDIYAERKWVQFYGGTMAYRKGNTAESALARLSPDYTDEESRRIWAGNEFSTPILLPEILSRDLGVKKLDWPPHPLGRPSRHERERRGRCRMVRQGQGPREAHRLVRALGPPADDRGARQVPRLTAALCPSVRRTGRRRGALTARLETRRSAA